MNTLTQTRLTPAGVPTLTSSAPTPGMGAALGSEFVKLTSVRAYKAIAGLTMLVGGFAAFAVIDRHYGIAAGIFAVMVPLFINEVSPIRLTGSFGAIH